MTAFARLPSPVVGAALALAAAVVAAACGGAAADGPGAGRAAAGAAVVVRVVDGDTVRVRILRAAPAEEAVRLIGVDTPETHGQGGLRECFGQEAAARLADLLPPGTAVRLERDVEPRDRYDRLLAYVYRDADDLFVNLSLAAEGYAAALTVPPNVAHRDAFVEAAAEARRRDLGLWGRCGNADVALEAPVDLPP